MRKTAERLQARSMESPDEVRTFEKGKLELLKLGEATVGRATFEPGWKWSECVGPIAKTKSCQASHFGFQLSGTMKIVADDGTERTILAGDAFVIPPGHDAWVEGEEKVICLDFEGMAEYAKPKEHRSGTGGRRH